jgi:hypothetical protein
MFFDLVLVFTTFRQCGQYLPLVKEMISDYKIGIYIYPLDSHDLAKTKEQNKTFLNLMYRFGVKDITNDSLSCKIILLPQWHYNSKDIDRIYSNINSGLHYWVLNLAKGNILYENLNNNRIEKILVVDRNFYNFRLSKRPEEQGVIPHEIDIVEVGTPHLKYPVFKDIMMDYIIANPTPFSFPMLEDKLKYLNNIMVLVTQIATEKTIVYKPHNAYGKDSLVHPKVHRMMNYIPSDIIKKLIFNFFRILNSFSKIKLINKICMEFEIVDIQNQLMSRVQPLKKITKYHDNNLEMFLPYVKEGLITGRSNVIWHALHAKLPIYNCIPNSTKEVKRAFKKFAPNHQDGEKMHPHNMTYFNVKFCNGVLDFDVKKMDIIEDKTRKTNLIDFLHKELIKK